MRDIEVDGVGTLTYDEREAWHVSPAVSVGSLGGATAVIVFSGYDDDPDPDEFRQVATRFVTADDAALRSGADLVRADYRTTVGFVPEVRVEALDDAAADIWAYVDLGDEVMVSREPSDGRVYVSVECECAWSPEHGLQLVFRDGTTLSKAGPYDGSNI